MSATFKWKGIEGTKYGEGRIEALSRDEAAFKLKNQKIIITSLEKVSGVEEREEVASNSRKWNLLGNKKVPLDELMMFTKKLGTMIRAGLPILETLKVLEEQVTHRALKPIAERITVDVESGSSLSDSFAQHPDVFDSIYINLLRAGESSGNVDLFLEKLVIGMKKSQQISSSIKGALTYPIILLSVAIAVIVLMMIYVVPVFQNMFSGAGSELPAITQVVVDISEFIRNPLKGGLLVVLLFISVSISITGVRKSYSLRRSWHKLILRVPLFGELIQKSALAKISMIQGNLTAAGVPVLEGLDIAAMSTNNLVIREAMDDVKKGVFSGDPLSELFSKRPEVFTSTFSAMVSVGERTGNMEEMFESISLFYEEETDTTIERLTSMLEPIMIVFMGATIGFILVALYTPMFSLGQVLQ